ncbi:BBE domain-containing protein [Microbispora rosea]|uniref:BBE domain-containing protein n=1 Tax=Microbispora rosea TaxID=58117 RepID=UPI003D914E73
MHPEIALRNLADGFDGEVILPQDAGYESARRVWNQAIDRKPAAIDRCRTRADAVAALALGGGNGRFSRIFGPACDNYDRLARLNRTWDPENLFRLKQNVPPA